MGDGRDACEQLTCSQGAATHTKLINGENQALALADVAMRPQPMAKEFVIGTNVTILRDMNYNEPRYLSHRRCTCNYSQALNDRRAKCIWQEMMWTGKSRIGSNNQQSATHNKTQIAILTSLMLQLLFPAAC